MKLSKRHKIRSPLKHSSLHITSNTTTFTLTTSNTMANARNLAEQFHNELEVAAASSEGLLDLIKKHYADDVEQYEAGQEVHADHREWRC